MWGKWKLRREGDESTNGAASGRERERESFVV